MFSCQPSAFSYQLQKGSRNKVGSIQIAAMSPELKALNAMRYAIP